MPKVREAIRMREREGWVCCELMEATGIFRRPAKKGLVTVAGRLRDDLAAGTWNSILKQAGLSRRGER